MSNTITNATTKIDILDETETEQKEDAVQAFRPSVPSKNVRFSEIELLDIARVQIRDVEDEEEEDLSENEEEDYDKKKSRYRRFLSELSAFWHFGRRKTREEYEDEDDISLQDLTPYLHPGEHEYVDEDLARINQSILEKTPTWYALPDKTSAPDKIFTAVLIASTAIAIIVLFLYQNFGPGNLGKEH